MYLLNEIIKRVEVRLVFNEGTKCKTGRKCMQESIYHGVRFGISK